MARWGERGWKNSWWGRVAGKSTQWRGMAEAPENSKESSNSAHANGMNEYGKQMEKDCKGMFSASFRVSLWKNRWRSQEISVEYQVL